MKKIVLYLIVMLLVPNICKSQEWLTSFEAAKRLAIVQDKMILMVWEESTLYPMRVIVENDQGKKMVMNNLFKNEVLNTLIWDYFVPVKVNESMYEELYDNIKGKRSAVYIDKFNDDSLKIMDANGNILNLAYSYQEIFNLTAFINKYYINTSFFKAELQNYFKESNFVTSFRLASKYIDAAIYVNENIRLETIKLSNIYLNEARMYASTTEMENKASFEQRVLLLDLEQELVLNKPRKVLRFLKRIDSSEIHENNEALVAFLYVTAYRLIKDENNASEWRSKVSLVNLKKSNAIINNNK